MVMQCIFGENSSKKALANRKKWSSREIWTTTGLMASLFVGFDARFKKLVGLKLVLQKEFSFPTRNYAVSYSKVFDFQIVVCVIVLSIAFIILFLAGF